MVLAPAKLERITAAERTMARWPASKMLLFQHPHFQEAPNATVKAYRMDWKTWFVSILVNPVVASMLFMGMMIGFYIEINSPGFGVPGSIGLICLLLIILSSVALEAVGWLEVLLMVIGLVLIAADILLIPTFGLLGTVGIVFLIAGLLGLLVPGLEAIDFDFDSKTLNAAGEAALVRLAWLAAALLGSVAVIAALGRYILPRASLFRRFVLEGEEDASEGYVAGLRPEAQPAVGARGESVSTLRPAGKVSIDGVLHDAVSDGQFIEQGVRVVVVATEGSQIIVAEEEKERNKS